MAGSQNRGPLGSATNFPEVDSGTLALTNSQLPGAICLSKQPAARQYRWGLWEIIRWKVMPAWLGGDRTLLKNYKDAWVRNQKGHIADLASRNQIPPLLLAGIAWIEVGGDPDWIDNVAYPIRAFDHAADPGLEPLTITKRPELTSFGGVSIQLRRAAEALGLDYRTMSDEQRDTLISCLTADETNLNVVAEYVTRLRQIDFSNSRVWNDDQIRVVGARYNRGSDLSLQSIRQNTSYGDFILKNQLHILGLLK